MVQHIGDGEADGARERSKAEVKRIGISSKLEIPTLLPLCDSPSTTQLSRASNFQ
jgi:hypothetical protein